jgi:hypothetical protein
MDEMGEMLVCECYYVRVTVETVSLVLKESIVERLYLPVLYSSSISLHLVFCTSSLRQKKI